MTATAFGRAIETLHDGLTTFRKGEHFVARPGPLRATTIEVTPFGPLALVRIARRFRNDEEVPVEAILTMPVGFDTVVTGLSVVVDGRRLDARANPRAAARKTYEEALDRGKLAVLHEEVLRGVHMLSVAQLGAGAEAEVILELVQPLSRLGHGALLRLPMTVGDIYGHSPLLPADDLVTATGVQTAGRLTLTDGEAVLVATGEQVRSGLPVDLRLGAAVELRFAEVGAARLGGMDAFGRTVQLDVRPEADGDGALDLAILVDRSGSTGGQAGDGLSIHAAMARGLASALAGLRGDDRIALWQFDSTCERVGAGIGPDCAALAAALGGPRGGTELGTAVTTLLGQGARDVLVLTDGQTWAHEVDHLAGSGCRIGAVLVGRGSLDANIGHLAALTGGQVFHAAGADVAAALAPALAACRTCAAPVEGVVEDGRPQRLAAARSGWRIEARWSAPDGAAAPAADALGRYAAALALPLLPTEEATDWAVRHGLCTHATSLVLVDEAGATQSLLPETRKLALDRGDMAPVLHAAMRVEPRRMDGVLHYSRPDAGILPSPSFRPRLHKTMPQRQARDTGPARDEWFTRLVAKLDWAGQANAFLRGDLSALSAGERHLLMIGFGSNGLAALAARLGHPAEVVALALAAALFAPDDRAAARFARRVLGEDVTSDRSLLRDLAR